MSAEDSAAPAIEVRGLGKQFGTVVALEDVSFRVAPGELFFVLGPSGCGKTTLLRILAGLETPDAGTVYFEGRDVAELDAHLRGAPMVFQSYALWPHLNVRQNVAFGLVERRVARDETNRRVGEALDTVGLSGLGERKPSQLSGGQQQRVVLARALVLNPGVVLLDEPLSNLDARLRHDMRQEIQRLHADTDITFVYVTHDQAEALSLADRIAVMNRGAICAVDTPRRLYHRPGDAFCADFLGQANLLPATVRTTGGDDRIEVTTALGPWRAICAGPAAPGPGDSVSVLVRPESLEPARGAPGPPGANVFEAEVISLRMNGATTTVVLDADGQVLTADLLSRYDLPVAQGERIAWRVAVEQTVLLVTDD